MTQPSPGPTPQALLAAVKAGRVQLRRTMASPGAAVDLYLVDGTPAGARTQRSLALMAARGRLRQAGPFQPQAAVSFAPIEATGT